MSSKVQPGGMFNSYKANYSPETHNLIKVLMDEAKLSAGLRTRVKESMKRGEPLPIIRRKAKPTYVDENLFDLKKNYYFFRRSQDQIIHSGAYDRDRYRCLERTVDLEKEKDRLRNIMEYGKHGPKLLEKEKKAKVEEKCETSTWNRKNLTPEERLEELIVEIEDRLEFLKDMEILGKAKQYEATIKQEIAAKIREIKNLDKSVAEKYSEFFGPPKNSKTFINNIFHC